MEQRRVTMRQMTLATAGLVIARCHRPVILGGIRPAVGEMTVDHHHHFTALVETRDQDHVQTVRPYCQLPHKAPLTPTPSSTALRPREKCEFPLAVHPAFLSDTALHPAHVCEICSRRFSVASNLNRHVRRCAYRPVNTMHSASASSGQPPPGSDSSPWILVHRHLRGSRRTSSWSSLSQSLVQSPRSCC